jgi:TFIIH p62 subunit, N-terminal domain/BSD domain
LFYRNDQPSLGSGFLQEAQGYFICQTDTDRVDSSARSILCRPSRHPHRVNTTYFLFHLFPKSLGLQATPVSNPKVMIKVFVSQNPSQEPVPNVFTFTSANAREDCDAIQEAIKIATAERNRPKTVADILREGEEGLLRNTDIQMSLLKQDVELSKMFRGLVIEGQLTDEQFWRARVVRSHRIGKAYL